MMPVFNVHNHPSNFMKLQHTRATAEYNQAVSQ